VTTDNGTFDVKMPKLNSVDETYVLVEWLVADGEPVTAGQPIAVVESSKAATEIEAAGAGRLRHRAAEGAECRIGEALATVAGDGAAGRADPEQVISPADPDGKPLLSARARSLADLHGITDKQLSGLRRAVIREQDVAEFVRRADEDGHTISLSANQLGVRASVEKSAREIPAAYAATIVRAGAAVAFAVEQSRAAHTLIGLPEIVIRAVARQFAAHPLFFGSLTAPDTVRVPPAADVGVTLDMGSGLFVPVVRDIDRSSAAELARQLMRLRLQAARGRFSSDDLQSPTIVLALNNTESVFAVPIIFPGTVACISLGTTRRVADVSENGTARLVEEVQLGVAYDHRVINGNQVGAFLQALRGELENPVGLWPEAE
jgi:2-oxoglutarate dehydrogenase E2 component (dihydrolipoamide succinyltransferase)